MRAAGTQVDQTQRDVDHGQPATDQKQIVPTGHALERPRRPRIRHVQRRIHRPRAFLERRVSRSRHPGCQHQPVTLDLPAVGQPHQPALTHAGDAHGFAMHPRERPLRSIGDRLLEQVCEIVAVGAAGHERGGPHGLAVLGQPAAEVAGIVCQPTHVGGHHVQQVVGEGGAVGDAACDPIAALNDVTSTGAPARSRCTATSVPAAPPPTTATDTPIGPRIPGGTAE